MDDADGLIYYWHDLRERKPHMIHRTSGGGSVIIWRATLTKREITVNYS